MDPFLLLMFCVYHAILSVHCSLVVTCWERANLLALLYVMFYVLVTFPCDVLVQVSYLILLIPDLRLLPYFQNRHVLSFSYLSIPSKHSGWHMAGFHDTHLLFHVCFTPSIFSLLNLDTEVVMYNLYHLSTTLLKMIDKKIRSSNTIDLISELKTQH